MNPIRSLFLLLILVPISWAAETSLPPDAQSAIADYDTKVSKLKGELVAKLQKAQDAATKKGNLEVALAIKGKIAGLGTDSEDMLGAKAPEPLAGTFTFTLSNGITGKITLTNTKAMDLRAGIPGTVKATDNKTIIHWSNDTEWSITSTDGKLSLETREGAAKIEKAQ